MKLKIHKDCIIYFHIPYNQTELLQEDSYKVFGENVGERLELIAKYFDESDILTEHFYKVIPRTNKKIYYRPSSL